MKDIFKLWQNIENQLDKDKDIEVDEFLDKYGYQDSVVPESISEKSEALLDCTFNPELLPENTLLSKYKIKQQINSGGQSEIYLADRSDGIYNKTVVIKFIAQRYSFEKLRQQFLQEMQLLADLNHPGIVQILDGGLTKENQPWLVLEHIDGLHIDEYCKDLDLSINSIVKLFINLCEALNFVHQRGVVHMDIKASNILINTINNIPYPVIIDFGISNIQRNNDKTIPQDEIFGTAGYSAPEQITTGQADNRADIYSLGMLLAQLLTKNEVVNIGLEKPKDRIVLLKKYKVPIDLIHIIQKTIRKKPESRYQNIESLHLDLNNYLHQLPLIANQNHIGHVVYKTYKRHKIATLMTVLFMLTAITFAFKYTTDISELQQITAKEKNASDELFNYMLTDLFKNLSQIGRTDILKQVAEKSIEHLQKQDSRAIDANTKLQTAVAYSNAGKVFDALDLSSQALSSYDQAIASLNLLADNQLYIKDYTRQMSLIKNLKGLTLTSEGQEQKTEQNLLESLQLSKALYKISPNEELSLSYEAHTQLGWYYMDYNQPQKALKHINLAINDAKQMNARFSSETTDYDWLFNLSQALQVLAWYEFDYGQADETIINLKKAIQLADRTVNEDGSSILYYFNQTTLLNQLSFIYLENNQLQDAQNSIDKAIAIGIKLQQKAPKNQDYQRELAYSYTTAGQILEQQNLTQQSLTMYEKGIRISKIMSQNDPKNFSTANDYAIDLIHIGSTYNKLKQTKKAKQYWSQAIEIMKPIHLLEPNNKYYMSTLISALIKAKHYQQAKPLITVLQQAGFNDIDFDLLLKQHNLK